MDLALFKANLFTPGLNNRWGLPRVYWGPPGVAKTSRIKQLCHEYGVKVISLSVATRDPSDILGVPVPVEHPVLGMVTRCAAPGWAADAADTEDVMIFFDEINTASKSTQNALLTVMLDGVVGEYQLPPTVRLVAAANPENMTGGGVKMNTALANRFGHEYVNLSKDQTKAVITQSDLKRWTQWLRDSGESAPADAVDGSKAKAERQRVMNSWAPIYARARAVVAGFIESSGGGLKTLMNMPEKTDPKSSRAWASMRSWECATRVLAATEIHNLPEVTSDNWMASHVGIGPIAALKAHMHEMALPRPDALLDGQVTWEFDKTRGDRTLAVLSACSSLLTSEGGHTQQREDAYWGLMQQVCEYAPSHAVPSAQTMIKHGLCSSKASAKPMAKLRPTLKASGTIRSR